jgi:acid phosphatase class B
MKKILTTLISILFVFAIAITVAAQNTNSSTTAANSNNTNAPKHKPIFRASKDQINQAQAILTRAPDSGSIRQPKA